MGHDMTAIRDYEKYQKFWNKPNSDFSTKKVDAFRKKNEITHLRRSMNSETIKKVYEFLFCENNYNGVSGDGNFIIVSLETLKEAKEKLKSNKSLFDKEDYKDYKKFIYDCGHYCEVNFRKGVIIHFG